MARLLQRLTPALLLAASAASAQPTRPFSHRVHLKLVPECITCHRGAAESTTPADSLLPAKDACRPCHAEVTIKRPSPSLVTKFSHKRHLALGNIAPVIAAAIDRKTYLSPAGDQRRHLNTTNSCGACHRGLHESDVVSASAHARMADCLVCHTEIDPPFSCAYCHDPKANLKPDDHTPDFLERHSAPGALSDKTSCAVCHGRKFTCLGCH